MDLCSQSNVLSRLVITVLPKSKRCLITWLPSPSAVILKPQKIVCHCFHYFPIYAGDTGPPTPRCPDKTYPRNGPPSNAHLTLPPTTCTPLPHTCSARAQIHSQAHPLSDILVIHSLLGQPHPNTQQQTSFPTLISLRFQGIGDSPLHFLPPLQTLLFPLK